MYEKSFKGPIICIRHAESKFNEKLKINPQSKNDMDLIDCGITELGIGQCNELKWKLDTMKINTVFISPLNRTIETCYHSLKDHPNFSNIRFVILPLAAEIIDSSCDIPISIDEKKKERFSSYDFNLDWEYCRDYYFLEQIDNKEFEEDKKNLNYFNYDSNFPLIVKHLEAINKKGFALESLENLYRRAQELKNYLKGFLSSYELKNEEKVLVYTHSAFLKMLTTSIGNDKVKSDQFPDDSYNCQNCEAITINI